MTNKRLLIWATGGKDGGGSGFQEMVEFSRTDPPILDAWIVGVVSNHEFGGVRKRADKLKIPFYHWQGDDYSAKHYLEVANFFRADYHMLSGWLYRVRGLPADRTVNIHPAWLPGDGSHGEFGGKGMWGHRVHEAVIKAFREGRITQTAVSMHFVIDFDEKGYDRGPLFFRLPIKPHDDDTAESIGRRVNEKERAWQSFIMNLVIQGQIRLLKINEGTENQQWKVSCENSGLFHIIPGLLPQLRNEKEVV